MPAVAADDLDCSGAACKVTVGRIGSAGSAAGGTSAEVSDWCRSCLTTTGPVPPEGGLLNVYADQFAHMGVALEG